MSKTMRDLSRGESLITQAQVHWACLLPHILLMSVCVGFFTIWKPLISMFTTDLALTDKRVYGKRGLINTRSLDTPLNKVNTVSVSSGLFGKIFGYGTLHITSSSGAYVFPYIKTPDVFRTAIMDAIDSFDRSCIKKQASEMAAAMRSV